MVYAKASKFECMYGLTKAGSSEGLSFDERQILYNLGNAFGMGNVDVVVDYNHMISAIKKEVEAHGERQQARPQADRELEEAQKALDQKRQSVVEPLVPTRIPTLKIS
jgi:hypothetical protein